MPRAQGCAGAVDIEHPLQALRPGHRCSALGGRWRFIRYFSLVPFAPPGRGHQGTMFAIGHEHTMEPGKVDSGPGHQRGQGFLREEKHQGYRLILDKLNSVPGAKS